MNYNTEIGRRVFGLAFIVALFSLFFNSCSNPSAESKNEKTGKDSTTSVRIKKLPGISFEDQLELEKKYPDSISIKEAEEFFDLDLSIKNEIAKVSYSFLDLDSDGFPDKIISIEGDFELGSCIEHIILINKKEFYFNVGFVSQLQHEGPIDFKPIRIDENNDKYFLLNTQGWGSGYYALFETIYQIEKDTIVELFAYPTHASYVLDFGDYYPMEVIDCKHEFINDSILHFDLELYYIINAHEKEIKSKIFKENVNMVLVNNRGKKDFKVKESTNLDFLEIEVFFPLTFYEFYGGKLSNPFFKKAWENFQNIE